MFYCMFNVGGGGAGSNIVQTNTASLLIGALARALTMIRSRARRGTPKRVNFFAGLTSLREQIMT